MTRTWRVGAVAAAGVAVGVAMLLSGMEPRLALVGLVVVVVATAGSLVAELAPLATPLVWYRHSSATRVSARSDRRVQTLTSRLRQSSRTRPRNPLSNNDRDDNDPLDVVTDSLVDIVEGHLLDVHGVERTSPQAASLLGPELTSFVNDPDARRAMTGRRTLPHTVSLIEDFTSSTTTN